MARVLWMCLLLGACGKSEAVVAYEQLAEAVCKCPDEACAQKVGLEFKDEMSQAVMKPVGAENYDYTYVIMPMRV